MLVPFGGLPFKPRKCCGKFVLRGRHVSVGCWNVAQYCQWGLEMVVVVVTQFLSSGRKASISSLRAR